MQTCKKSFRGNSAKLLALGVVFALAGLPFNADAKPKKPGKEDVEVGDVKWQRDLDAALKQSGETGKPVFLLFQEVPGCSTCKNFGQNVLSHPQIVKAIEEAFIPVLVYNNRPGADAQLLKRFREPAWNNPVVRFVDAKGKDIIPKKGSVFTADAIAARMREALKETNRPVPDCLTDNDLMQKGKRKRSKK